MPIKRTQNVSKNLDFNLLTFLFHGATHNCPQDHGGCVKTKPNILLNKMFTNTFLQRRSIGAFCYAKCTDTIKVFTLTFVKSVCYFFNQLILKFFFQILFIWLLFCRTK